MCSQNTAEGTHGLSSTRLGLTFDIIGYLQHEVVVGWTFRSVPSARLRGCVEMGVERAVVGLR